MNYLSTHISEINFNLIKATHIRPGVAFTYEQGIVHLLNTIPDGFVDLGLPSGTVWCKKNVGAETITSYGDYFSWGETTSKLNYAFSTYKYAGIASNKFIKYCPTNKSEYWSGNENPDNVLTLLGEDDAATYMNSQWKTPTIELFNELKSLPNKFTMVNGVKGRLFVKSSEELNEEFNEDTMLFLPAGGNKANTSTSGAGTNGRYWSSELYTDNPSQANNFTFNSKAISWSTGSRCYADLVRPVLTML